MERLTNREFDRAWCNTECAETGKYGCDECEHFHNMRDKLAKYEDLEEQGLLLRLPCKVGDTVYTTSSYFDCDEDECVNIDFCVCEEDGGTCEHLAKKYFVKETNFQIQMLAVFGKTVFLTKAEAEEALKKMEERK